MVDRLESFSRWVKMVPARAWWISGFSAVCFFAVFGTMLACSPVPKTVQGLLETLNGATWPADEVTLILQTDHRAWFAFFVALRTVLNLALPVSFIAGGLWFLSHGWRLMMQMSLVETIRMHESGLVNAVLMKVMELHPELKLSAADIEAIHKKAAIVFSEVSDDLTAAQQDRPQR